MAPADFNQDIDGLLWSIKKVAAIKGKVLSDLEIDWIRSEAIADVQSENPVFKPGTRQELAWIVGLLGFQEPSWTNFADRAFLPLIAYSSKVGWGLVLSQNGNGSWVFEFPPAVKGQDGRQESIEDISNFHFSRLEELTQSDLSGSDETVFSMIKREFIKRKNMIMEAALGGVIANIIGLATSLYSMQVYDRVVPTQGYQTLAVLTLGVFIASVFEYYIKKARSKVLEPAIIDMDVALSRKIFHRVMSIRLDQMPKSTGSLTGQIRGFEIIRGFLSAATLYILVDVPFGILFVVMIGILGGPLMAMIPALFLVCTLILGFSNRKLLQQHATDGANVGNGRVGLLLESVEGAETIKSTGGAWTFLSRWIDTTDKSLGHEFRMREINEHASHMTQLCQQISYVLLTAVGAYEITQGNFSNGGVIACSIIAGRALAPAGMIPTLFVQMAHAKAALAGLEKIWGLELDNHGVDRPLTPSAIAGHYRMDQVTFSYSESAPALSVPALDIQPGEKVGIMGPVGAGKTTLLRLLSGMYIPKEGRILLDGLDISHISRPLLVENIGYLQQDGRLFSGTLRENLILGMPDPGDARIREITKLTSLEQLIVAHPKGLSIPISEGGAGLSGGQKQLIGLSRLMLLNPKVWLMDEPTASMDEPLEVRCMTAIKEIIQPDQALIIVTHKPALLDLVDRLIIVSGHRIILDGPKDLVLRRIDELTHAAPAQPQVAASPSAI